MADLSIPVGYGLWQMYLQHTGLQHTAVVTLGFHVSTPPYTQANNNAALLAWQASLNQLWDAEVAFSRLVALVGNDGPLLRYESLNGGIGSRSSVTVAPPNVTYLLRKTSAFAGRRFRGRMYLPYVNNAGIQQTGALVSTELTLLTARAAALQSNLTVTGTINVDSLALLHASSPLSATPTPTVCTLAADDFVATQRRRLDRQ